MAPARRLDEIARAQVLEQVDAASGLIRTGGSSIVTLVMGGEEFRRFMAQLWKTKSSARRRRMPGGTNARLPRDWDRHHPCSFVAPPPSRPHSIRLPERGRTTSLDFAAEVPQSNWTPPLARPRLACGLGKQTNENRPRRPIRSRPTFRGPASAATDSERRSESPDPAWPHSLNCVATAWRGPVSSALFVAKHLPPATDRWDPPR
jgi:hypothetical protein